MWSGRNDAMRRTGFLPVSVLAFLGCWLAAAFATPGFAANDFRLKAGAEGRICLKCHEDFADILKKRSVHTPVAKLECSSCHNPHTSSHDKMLAGEPGEICKDCHRDLFPKKVRSAHEVFVAGKCALCHDPHAADNPKNLIRAGSALCFECHQELGKKIEDNEFQHDPVNKSCLDCHNPHTSTVSTQLLKKSQPALCLECHESGKATFKQAHNNYPVERARCTACHDPHGSSTRGILFDNVHDPVADRKCDECHGKPTASSPFALKNTGFEICEGCHYDEVADAFNKMRIHWPVVDSVGCVNCHSPHASAQDALLKAPMLVVCGQCHEDTVARQERSKTKHPPVAEGECTDCHSPHASDNLFLANEASTLDLCGECHDWEAHSTHPIGEKVVDPRNPNLTLQCTSCHRAHGTEYDVFLYFETTNDMCVQCHTEYRR
jgi:DmsE family decaheme c-type cytochrome